MHESISESHSADIQHIAALRKSAVQSAPPAAYWLLALNHGPYFQRAKGAGTPSIIARNAIKLFPQPYSNIWYMYGANSGKLNPAKERKKVLAAEADAA